MVHEFHLIHVTVDLYYVEFNVGFWVGMAAELKEVWC